MAIQYNNQYAGLRSAGTRGDYRVQRTDLGGITRSVTDTGAVWNAAAASAQGRAMQSAAQINAAAQVASSGAQAVGNVASSALQGAAQVGSAGIGAAGQVKATQISADAAIESAYADRMMKMFGTAATLGLGAWAMSRPEEPYPEYKG